MSLTMIPPEEPRIGDHNILVGGLFRCCIEYIEQHAEYPVPGDKTLTCTGCKGTMKLNDEGLWQWVGLMK